MSKFNHLLSKLKSKRYLAFNIGYYFAASLVGAAIQLALNPFLALNLEYLDYAIIGYYSSFNSLFAPLIMFSLSSYYCRQYFLVPGSERPRLRNTITIMSILLSAILALLSYLGLYTYCKILNVSLPFHPFALLSIATMFFNSTYTIFVVDLRMSRKAKKFLGVHVAHAALAASAAILLVIVLKKGANGRMLATMITAIVFAIYSVFNLVSKLEIDKTHVLKSLAFCWPLAVAAMLGYFYSGVDRAMLERINDSKSLGLYNIAIQISGYIAIFTQALSQTFQPDIYKSIAENNKKKLLIVIAVILVLGLIPIMIFIVLAPFLLSILTFGRFTAAAGFARILSLKNLTMALYHSICGVLEGYGKTKLVLITRIIGSILTVALFKLLIGRFGFFGAAWGQVIPYGLMALLSIGLIMIMKKSITPWR